MINLVTKLLPHLLNSLLTSPPSLNNPILQLLRPSLQNLEHNFLTFLMGEGFLLREDLDEPFFYYLEAAIYVGVHH